MSTQLDLDVCGYTFTTFHGAWAREMCKNEQQVFAGQVVNATVAGTSSNRSNPFVMISKKDTTEEHGECIGCNLIYSGNHYETLEVNSFGKTRFLSGINPATFTFSVESGEKFESPEAVMAYSLEGFGGMSRNMHEFVRNHVVRGEWAKKVRPVLLNSWEAAYFDINEKKLLNLAKVGKEVGIELFVMDDGWFGERNDDTSSLGDWKVNEKKLPGGLEGLCKKIKALGLEFGIWVEPEMVNERSQLYEAHPEWVMRIPGKPHTEGRNQMILDLSQKTVQNFIIEKMSEVFSSADISYVKWDMNRIVSDYYSPALPPSRQGEVAHRYICGLYHVMETLTEKFPQILFEGCAAGGNRFDLGILSYFPQIWASDDTDAVCRAEMQNNYSYGYPLSVVSAHVSSVPNHQTLRRTPLETRFGVAAFGICGYECNFCDMGKEELEAVKTQIALYKEWREVLQTGTFYRGKSFTGGGYDSGNTIALDGGLGSVLQDRGGNYTEWTCVSRDRTKAVGFLMQKLVMPNTITHVYRAKGLTEEKQYHFYNRELKYDVKDFGDLVNTVAPIHIRQGSFTHNLIAKFVKMDGEKEDYILSGSVLMNSGVHLKQAFGATGYNEETRFFPDFGSRLYFMEEI